MTTPNKISDALRYVASKLEASKSPSRSLVASDLNLIISAISGQQRIAAADSDQALADLLWKSEEGKDVEEAYDVAKKAPVEDKLIQALNGLKSSVDDFVSELKGGKTVRKQIREEEESGDVVTTAPQMKRK